MSAVYGCLRAGMEPPALLCMCLGAYLMVMGTNALIQDACLNKYDNGYCKTDMF